MQSYCGGKNEVGGAGIVGGAGMDGRAGIVGGAGLVGEVGLVGGAGLVGEVSGTDTSALIHHRGRPDAASRFRQNHRGPGPGEEAMQQVEGDFDEVHVEFVFKSM